MVNKKKNKNTGPPKYQKDELRKPNQNDRYKTVNIKPKVVEIEHFYYNFEIETTDPFTDNKTNITSYTLLKAASPEEAELQVKKLYKERDQTIFKLILLNTKSSYEK